MQANCGQLFQQYKIILLIVLIHEDPWRTSETVTYTDNPAMSQNNTPFNGI